MRTRRWVAALALPLVLATGCGDDSASTADDPEPTPTSASPTETTTPTEKPDPSPQCSDVWVDGVTFPERYRGCFEGTERIQAESVYCEFGTRLFFYGNRFYAVPNGPVNETDDPLAKDDGFKTAINKCGG